MPNQPATRNQLELAIAAIGRDASAPRLPDIAFRQTEPERVESFGRWLISQRDRGDWIDDLANAARSDRQLPRDATPDQVRDRLRLMGADGDAFEQVDDAERIWLSL